MTVVVVSRGGREREKLVTDPEPGRRARLTIAEATYSGDGWWVVPGGYKYFYPEGSGLSWEALPDPLPVEDREALYMDTGLLIWRWSESSCLWLRGVRQTSGVTAMFPWELPWGRLVRERGPLRRYTLDET